MELNREAARKVLSIVDAGLSHGMGTPEPGKMCVEAAVCFALGLPHSDDPGCVAPSLRSLKIALNDKNWSSPAARAKGLRRLAIAQLGSKDVLDEKVFLERVVEMTIRRIVPKALRAAASVQTGKVMELSLGYQGGLGAFRKMEKSLGIKLGLSDDEVQQAKDNWRQAHGRITQLWYDYEDAAIRAVLSPGLAVSAGPGGRAIKFKVSGSFLWCLLPSGRTLCYPYPKVKPIETPWGETKDAVQYMTVDGTTNKWVETHTYGGKLAENVTQAICRDLLAHAIVNAEAAGYPVVLHVHDEVVSEMPKGAGTLEEFERICARTPKWAEGLPVTTAGWRGERYRKG